MVTDGRLAEIEGSGEVAHADRIRSGGQDVNDLDTRRIAERPVEGRQFVGVRIWERRSHGLAAALDAVEPLERRESGLRGGGHVLILPIDNLRCDELLSDTSIDAHRWETAMDCDCPCGSCPCDCDCDCC
jgi:hypothetical protein